MTSQLNESRRREELATREEDGTGPDSQAVRRLIGLLAAMPDAQPPSDLVSRTLKHVNQSGAPGAKFS
jgi:hypothetical protein